MDQEKAKLHANQNFNMLHGLFMSAKNNLKEQVSSKFNEWRDIMTLMEQGIHQTIDDRFSRFEKLFDEEGKVMERIEEENQHIQFKVGEMLNNYMTQIEANPEYIAYEILDTNPDNLTSDTVESLYQKIEEWIEETNQTLNFERLRELEWEYDKVYVYFDKNFEERLTNLTQVVDQ